MEEIGNDFKLPTEENQLIQTIIRGQHTKGFVVYCQLMTEKIENHKFCEICPFHILHMKIRIPILCTEDTKLRYFQDGKSIKLQAKGVEFIGASLSLNKKGTEGFDDRYSHQGKS